MKKSNPAILNMAVGIVLGFLIAAPLAFTQREKQKAAPAYFQAPALPEQLSFAGEKMPLERWDIKERLDRELLINYYDPATMLFLIKISNRYFPIISERLKAAGVPDDFKYLCIAESNLVGTARSRVGAVGFWQFMDSTAPEYGLRVTSEIDDRYDIERTTDGACKYLKQAYLQFGSWTAAAASYNCGRSGYRNQAAFQGTTNYYDLYLPGETGRYIFRVLTFKYLMENAETLGFAMRAEEKYGTIPSRTIAVSSSIPNLTAFAQENGITYQRLRLLNPWLRGKSLTVPNGKTYELKLPVLSY